jgi:prevent-host-death family protein
MRVISPSQFRTNLFQIIKDVISLKDPIEIKTSNDKSVIIIDKEEYDRMEETLYLIENGVDMQIREREEKGDYIPYSDDLWDTI